MSKITGKFIELSHGSLGGLQGGQDGEHYHLTLAEWERKPERPVILSPTDGEINIDQVPQIRGVEYYHPFGIPMYGREIQISSGPDFLDGEIAYASQDDHEAGASVIFQVPLKPDETPYLAQGTTYYVRIRYQDRKGKWSEWSNTVSFTTMAEFPDTVLLRPVMVMPVDGAGISPKDPILAMTTAKVAVGLANFDRADWQISGDSTFETPLYNVERSSDVTMHVAAGLTLSSAVGSDFYARGRQWPAHYTDDDADKVPWTWPVRFGLRPDYDDPVFGTRRIFSKKYGKAYIWNIDPEGKQVYIPRSYFDKHPLYRFEDTTEELDIGDTGLTSRAAFVRPCYIKYSVYDNEDGDMVIDMWFSSTAQSEDGWMLHPAFAEAADGFWHGTYAAGSATSPIDGKYYYISRGNLSGASIPTTLIQLTNLTAKDARWRVWTVYERRYLFDLMMAEYLTFTPSRVSTGTGYDNKSTNFMWRGFCCLCEGGYYGVAVTKLRPYYATGSAPIDTVELVAPIGDNTIPISVSLDSFLNAHITDIARGYIPELGFDIALMGIVSRSEAWTDQTATTYGTLAKADLRSSYTYDMGTGILDRDLGLFACVPSQYQRPAFRLSRSL